MKKIQIPIFIVLLFMAQSVFAQSNLSSISLDQVFSNFTASGNSLIKLTRYVGLIIGVVLIINSIFKFAELGEAQGRTTIKVPLTMFLVGVVIFSSTSMLTVLTQTMSMGNGPGSVLMPSSSVGNLTSNAMMGVFLFIRLVGFIGFLRGWMMLNDIAQGKNASMATAITHILGGVAAINIQEFSQILANTFVPGLGLNFRG